VTRVPVVSGAQTTAALERGGFVHVRTRGSHAKLRHPATARTAIVPLHRELAPGTLASVLRQANLSVDEFRALLD
jgi:predicted RNA binding protein YcfA (HicA-like mRNA interferase family)